MDYWSEPSPYFNMTAEPGVYGNKTDNNHRFNHDEHINAFNAIYSLLDKNVTNQFMIDLTSISGISENFYDHIHPIK